MATSISRRRMLSTAATAATTTGMSRILRAQPDSQPLVQTHRGPIRGFVDKNISVFKGIPYGASTTGANRFQPAEEPARWDEPLDAFEFGSAAPQPASTLSPTPSTEEDCLVLNVWTPAATDRARRPVMVWLHGGGFSSLSGSSPMYDGVNLCSQGDVVVVSLNHRLNVFGFLHLADIADGFDTSGNEGMLDIVHALRWVRRNIRRFGGDPRNVTLFGESGGGRKVSTLMGMPDAKGLFHKAIIQSGPGIHLQPRDKATEVALALLDELKLQPAQVPQLQTLPVPDILDAYTAVEGGFDPLARAKGLFEQRGFVPTVGVPALPAYSFDPDASAISKDVPLLVGSNRHEMSLFMRNDPDIYEQMLSKEDLAARVAMMVGSQKDRVISVYTKAYPDASPAELWVLMVSDRTYRTDSITLAQRKAERGPATWMYYFTFTSRTDENLLSHHALEIPFAFNNLDKSPWTSGTPAEQKLALAISSAWIAFARDGKPQTPALPEWPQYDRKRRATMVLDEQCRVADDPDSVVRRLWATI